MKKKIINIFLILILIGLPFVVLADNEEIEEGTLKGSLRCPSDSNGKCQEIKNGDTVESIKVVEETKVDEGSIKVTKTVTKTVNIGEYKVKFDVEANGIEQQPVAKKAKVVVLMDASKTNKNNWNKLKEAVDNFIGYEKAGDFEIAVIQFADSANLIKDFNKAINYKSLGKKSHLELALENAYNKLSKIHEDVNKYVVIFGDGRYYEHGYASRSVTKGSYSWANKLKNDGIKVYGVRYDAEGAHPFNTKYVIKHGKDGSYQKDINYVFEGNVNNYHKFEVSDCVKYVNSDNVRSDIISYGCLDVHMMRNLVSQGSGYYQSAGAANMANFGSLFGSIASNIESTPGATGYDAVLKDNLGGNFYDKNNTATSKLFVIGKLNGKHSLDEFTIKIETNASTGWHDTNSGFQISYTAKDGVDKVFNYNINPEAYWVQESTNIEGCNGQMQIEQTADTNSINEKYYTKVCEEGYEDNGEFKPGFAVKISVNNFDADGNTIYEFDIEQGIGFPTNIKLNANVRCTFEFKIAEFNSSYNEITKLIEQIKDDLDINETEQKNLEKSIDAKQSELDNTSEKISYQECNTVGDNATGNDNENEISNDNNNDNEDISQGNETSEDKTPQNVCTTVTQDNKEYYDIYASLQQLNSDLESKIDNAKNLNSDLENASTSLDDLKSALNNFKDAYGNNTMEKDLNDYQSRFSDLETNMNIKYSKSSDSIKLINDENTIYTNVNCEKTEDFVMDQKIVVKEVCTATFKKEMIVPKTCLDMKTADSEECSSSNTQLDGGNKVYVSQEEDGGEITISIPNAGYKGDLDLGSEKCNFYKSNLDIIYRQIDVNDPFLSTYDTTREAGRNFANKLFNFVKIIKSNIWSSDPLTTYKMSKVNVEKIKEDTKEVDDSYLGRECYFTNLSSNNTYTCDFLKDEDSNFFQK